MKEKFFAPTFYKGDRVHLASGATGTVTRVIVPNRMKGCEDFVYEVQFDPGYSSRFTYQGCVLHPGN